MTNITNITNLQTLQGTADYIATGTGGLFFTMLIIGIFVILVINLRKNGIENALITGAFASLVISLFFVYFTWISLTVSIVFALMLGGLIFYKIFTGTQ